MKQYVIETVVQSANGAQVVAHTLTVESSTEPRVNVLEVAARPSTGDAEHLPPQPQPVMDAVDDASGMPTP